jgi:hypothetical protein
MLMAFDKLVKLFVVGDKFKCFITNSNIIGISQLEKIIKGELSASFDKCHVYVGQGVCEIHIKKIHDYVKRMKLNKKYKIIFPDYYHKSSKFLTHKHRNENIMISEPIQIGGSIYKCNLMLNDNCAEMSDHITGHHIQGMVVIEAARQMVLAVTEKYLIDKKLKAKPNFLTNSISVEFKNFIFPLQVEVTGEVIDIKKSVGNNLTCNFSISFIQNGQECVRLSCKSSVLDSDYIEEKEVYLAAQCIKSHFDGGLIAN